MTAEHADLPRSAIEVAADWFARRRSGRMTADEMAELEAWLDGDPDHAAAFREVTLGWEVAGAVRAEPRILQVRDQARRARPRAWSLALSGAAAACLALAVLGGWAVMGSGAFQVPALFAGGQQTFRTGVGQTSTVRLRDGSLVTLDTDTLLRARLTGERRMLRLEKGQAYFKVAKDPSRPFVVAAGDKLVTATGTAFTVRLERKAVEVVLVEGRVRVEEARPPGPAAAPAATEMKAGSTLVAAENEAWKLASIDASKAISWTSGQLIFEDRPLAEAVEELNRYSAKKIVIRDPTIGRAPIVSVVRAGDVDGFVRFVTLSGFARVVSNTEDVVELAAPEEKIVRSPPGGVQDF